MPRFVTQLAMHYLYDCVIDFLFYVIPSYLLALITFGTVTLPTLLVKTLGYTIILSFDFSTILFIFVLLSVVAYFLIRYRLQTRYARLKSTTTPKHPSPPFHLLPDATSADDSGPKAPYQDDFMIAFLASIRIFGYLEKNAFHELTKHFQTRKIPAGELLFRAESDWFDFYTIADGVVQVYVPGPHVGSMASPIPVGTESRSRKPTATSLNSETGFLDDLEADTFMSKHINKQILQKEGGPYRLLHEVTTGGAVSSLCGIVSILTEHLEPLPGNGGADEKCSSNTTAIFAAGEQESPQASQLETPVTLAKVQPSKLELDPNDCDNDCVMLDGDTPSIPLRSPSHSQGMKTGAASIAGTSPQRMTSVDTFNGSRAFVPPQVVAVAKTDVTAVVIPSEAFSRILERYPNAVMHIVQVILTRFQRVTLQTLYQYLGLSEELLHIERRMQGSVGSLEVSQILGEEEVAAVKSQRSPMFVYSKSKFGVNASVEPRNAKAIRAHKRHSSQSMRNVFASSQFQNSASSEAASVNSNSTASSLSALYSSSSSLGISSSSRNSIANLSSNASESSVEHGELSPETQEFMPGTDAVKTSQVSESMSLLEKEAGNKKQELGGIKNRLMNLPISSLSSPNASLKSPTLPLTGNATFMSGGGAEAPIHSENLSSAKLKVAHAIVKLTRMAYCSSNEPVKGPSRGMGSSLLSSSQRSSSSLRTQGPSGLGGGYRASANDALLHEPALERSPLFQRQSSGASGETGSTLLNKQCSEAILGDAVAEEIAASLEFKSVDRGTILLQEGEIARGLYFILEGLVEASVELGKTGVLGQELDSAHFEQKLSSETESGPARTGANLDDSSIEEKRQGPRKGFFVRPGSLAGYWASLAGGTAYVSYRTRTAVLAAFIPQTVVAKCLDRHPNALLFFSRSMISSLSQLVLQIDLALEWTQARAGHILCHERSLADSIHIVLSGRLRSIKEHGQNVDIVGEHGAGESVGEFEMLTNIRHQNTVHAIRDTELAKLPKALFHGLALRHPEIAIRVSRMIALRAAKKGGLNVSNGVPERRNLNLRTVAIVPVSGVVSVRQFAEHLKEAMESMNVSVEALTGEAVLHVLGRHAFSRVGKLKMMSWLADQEERHRLVLYIADSGVNSRWTQQCIRQADCILLVAMADDEPAIGEYEQLLLGMKTYARKELVLLHQERFSIASGTTQAWLKGRVWIQAHHHVHLPAKPSFMASVTASSPTVNALKASLAVFAPVKSNELASVVNRVNRLIFGKRPRNANAASGIDSRRGGTRSDFARLARRLLSRSIGLALGGGGARGIAHIGVLKALEEAGVPIDAVGGTSIGSFVGGLYAKECDHVSVMARAKQFSARMSSSFRQMLDLTWPTTSWFTGHAFNRSIWKCFDDTQIEDCWLPYFCVTTNIRLSRMEIHDSGYIWRYVRASMSLSGFLPPLCDRGDLLLDGGYLNNLPADVMRSKLDADIVIAVDVGSTDDTREVNYGDSLSGFWVIVSRWNPFSRKDTMPIPSLADIQSRLAYVSCAKQLEGVKRMDRCFYIKPPIDNIGTLEFNKFDQVLKIGYDYGQQVVEQWRQDGTLEKVFGISSKRKNSEKRRERRASI